MPFVRLIARAPLQPAKVVVVVLALTVGLAGQAGNSSTPLPSAPTPQGTTDQSPAPVVKVTTRMVSLEVVARDRQGRPVRGLTAKDFEVSEQVEPRKARHPQNISVFQAQDWADLQAAKPPAAELPPGVYSNLVNRQKQPVPPTVLLFDGINTDVVSQMEVHHQMVKILSSIPADVPVAVFLMGTRLRLLQTFTTDPKLLREAAAKTMVVGQAAPDQDPIDNPDSLAAALDGVANLPPGLQAALEGFEQAKFSLDANVRMHQTLDTLRSIARYLDGYPGRKNILWISTSFPLLLLPGEQTATGNSSDLNCLSGRHAGSRLRSYGRQDRHLSHGPRRGENPVNV